MKNLIITFIFLTISGLTQAGDEVGNGGNAVVCKEQGSTKVYSLDLYEAQIYERKIKLSPDQSVFQNLMSVFNDLETYDKELVDQLKRNLNELQLHIYFTESLLPAIDDSLHLRFENPNCHVQQAAINFKKPLYGKYKYLFQKQLFNQMDTVNKSGLLLHEIVYNEILKTTGQQNSVKARFFTAIISSDNLDLMSVFEYQVLKRYIFGSL